VTDDQAAAIAPMPRADDADGGDRPDDDDDQAPPTDGPTAVEPQPVSRGGSSAEPAPEVAVR
jgi:hypothetical protein